MHCSRWTCMMHIMKNVPQKTNIWKARKVYNESKENSLFVVMYHTEFKNMNKGKKWTTTYTEICPIPCTHKKNSNTLWTTQFTSLRNKINLCQFTDFCCKKDEVKLVEKLSFGQPKFFQLRRFIWLPKAFVQPKVLTFWTTTFSYMESCEFDINWERQPLICIPTLILILLNFAVMILIITKSSSYLRIWIYKVAS